MLYMPIVQCCMKLKYLSQPISVEGCSGHEQDALRVVVLASAAERKPPAGMQVRKQHAAALVRPAVTVPKAVGLHSDDPRLPEATVAVYFNRIVRSERQKHQCSGGLECAPLLSDAWSRVLGHCEFGWICGWHVRRTNSFVITAAVTKRL